MQRRHGSDTPDVQQRGTATEHAKQKTSGAMKYMTKPQIRAAIKRGERQRRPGCDTPEVDRGGTATEHADQRGTDREHADSPYEIPDRLITKAMEAFQGFAGIMPREYPPMPNYNDPLMHEMIVRNDAHWLGEWMDEYKKSEQCKWWLERPEMIMYRIQDLPLTAMAFVEVAGFVETMHFY